MCGIAGLLNADPQCPVQKTDLQRMVKAIAHRGPDDEGYFLDQNLGLAHKRLSILDLSQAGHQPMASSGSRYWITYNGEVYNFLELREKLEGKGYRFRSRSDTEVLLALYQEKGVESLEDLRGMYAFAIWDRQRRELFLVRDPLGIKPLYFYNGPHFFAFASEIKSILALPQVPREIDPGGLRNYFAYGHSTAPTTLFKGIFKLRPGHYLSLRQGRLKLREYWSPKPAPDRVEQAPDHAADELYRLLLDGVRSHLISDVPLGVFLSGGLDSSALVALMAEIGHRRIKTFTVGFDSGRHYDELSDARIVADHFHTDHHEVLLKTSDLRDSIGEMVRHFDEPFGDPAAFPTYFVSQLARSEVKVCLSGEGADELFGGYTRYIAERYGWLYRALPSFLARKVIPGVAARIPRSYKLKQLLRTISIADPVKRQANWQMVFTEDLRHELFTRTPFDGDHDEGVYESFSRHRPNAIDDGLNGVLFADCRSWLADRYLEKVDKMGMAHALETRVPFLDLPISEFAFGLPIDLKVKLMVHPGGRNLKRLMGQVLTKLLPDAVLKKPKHGFAVPLDPWFRGELRSFVAEILFDERTKQRKYFNPSVVERLFKEHAEGREVRKNHLWLMVLFEIWHRNYLDHSC